MAYPNSSPYNLIVSQTSGSAINGQYPFVERIISGSNLFIITDASGNLTGSTNIPTANFTNLTVTGALTASIISASTAITSAAATFTGPVTMSATLSASGGITASAIYDAGTLTVIGNSTLGTVTATSITSSLSGSSIQSGNATLTSVTGINTLSGANLVVSANAITSSTLYVTSNAVILGTVTAASITSSLSGSSVSTGNATIAGGTINGTSIGATAASTGNFTALTASNISSSGYITASSGYFSGNLFVGGTIVGTISGSITQAATASAVTITDTTSTAGTYYITFVDGTTGTRVVRTDSDGLSYNPSTNTLSSSGTISSSNAWNNTLIVTGTSTLGGLVSASAGLTSSAIYDSGTLTVAGITSLTNTTNNANFSTNNGLFVAGGATVSKDLWVSGSTTIAGNLTILGTSSIVNISSSTIIIGANRIELNASSPMMRYAGIDVFDSGSGTFVNQVTSSLLWDSLNDDWMMVSNNSSSGAPLTQSSAMIIGGPSGSFGNEAKLTNNFLTKAQATGKNIGDSKVSDDGITLLYTGTTISGSQISASHAFITGTITVNTGSFTTVTIVTGSSPGVGNVPTTPTSSGMPGQIEVDNNFIYVYTNAVWKRVPLSQWAN